MKNIRGSLVFMAVFLLLASVFGLAQGDKLSVIVFGAHPDDPEKIGATMAKFVDAGHRVTLVSMTNGNAGHFEMGGGPLAQRRYLETQCSGKVIGADYLVLDIDDGKLLPTLENREKVIRLIREVQADIVISHRPNDYHPDHRNTGLLVRDAAYMVTVPNIVPNTPHLRRNPLFMYMSDRFTSPNPYEADIAIDVTDTIEKRIDMYDCHVSQVYEWLPYNGNRLDQVPKDPQERREWMGKSRRAGSARDVERYKDLLIEYYGEAKYPEIKYADTLQVSEYGRRPSRDELKKIFPFFE